MNSNQSVEIGRSGNIEFKAVVDELNHVTRTEIRMYDPVFDDVVVFGRGTARWNPIDHHDPDIGKGIALGRALQKFGKKLADYWDKQAVSPGEHRARIKRKQEVMELGEVFYRSFNPAKTKPMSEEYAQSILAEQAKAKKPIQNAPQEPTVPLFSSEKKEGSLDTVIKENRSKLGVIPGEESPSVK